MREQLDCLIDEMLTKGIFYEDARLEIERAFISQALKRSNGNLAKAANLLGIHRNTLSRKVSNYKLKRTG